MIRIGMEAKRLFLDSIKYFRCFMRSIKVEYLILVYQMDGIF